MTAFLDLTEQVENTVGVVRALIGKIVGDQSASSSIAGANLKSACRAPPDLPPLVITKTMQSALSGIASIIRGMSSASNPNLAGGLLHHVAEQAFGFLSAVCQLADFELPVSQIGFGQGTADLMVVHFFYFHIITSLLYKILTESCRCDAQKRKICVPVRVIIYTRKCKKSSAWGNSFLFFLEIA